MCRTIGKCRWMHHPFLYGKSGHARNANSRREHGQRIETRASAVEAAAAQDTAPIEQRLARTQAQLRAMREAVA